jgi:hypothetical protein
MRRLFPPTVTRLNPAKFTINTMVKFRRFDNSIGDGVGAPQSWSYNSSGEVDMRRQVAALRWIVEEAHERGHRDQLISVDASIHLTASQEPLTTRGVSERAADDGGDASSEPVVGVGIVAAMSARGLGLGSGGEAVKERAEGGDLGTCEAAVDDEGGVPGVANEYSGREWYRDCEGCPTVVGRERFSLPLGDGLVRLRDT